ncbi:hypothetical protein [Nonomuraea sediminis]|uniref:hypothetical protein n=1 Tax=Nonomuraea sediminis TaxID=2835864 RepID=UPI001BDD9B31|nr:hypothetical protein [Nonomuraea sediminis]
MTATTPDQHYRLDDFGKTWLSEQADGWRAALQWLATSPYQHEVTEVAKIHRDLKDGGFTGCDIASYDATRYPAFLEFLKGSPYERKIIDGVAEMSDINSRQGTSYPAWPKECFFVGFDEAYILGFAAACWTAVKMR